MGSENINKINNLLKLKDEAADLENLPDKECMEKISVILAKFNAITDEDGTSTEMLLDSMILLKTSECLVNKLKNFKISEKFGWREMAFAVKNSSNNPEKLEELKQIDIFGGRDQCFHFSPMLVLLKADDCTQAKIEKKPRQRKEAMTQMTEPENIMDQDVIDSADAFTKIFNVVLQAYAENGKKPINFFRLVLNPNSFSESVENIFYTSFLFRDGYLKLELDEHGLPVIEPLVSSAQTNSQADKNKLLQNKTVFSIDMKTWKDLVRKLHIDHAMIPSLHENL